MYIYERSSTEINKRIAHFYAQNRTVARKNKDVEERFNLFTRLKSNNILVIIFTGLIRALASSLFTKRLYLSYHYFLKK